MWRLHSSETSSSFHIDPNILVVVCWFCLKEDLFWNSLNIPIFFFFLHTPQIYEEKANRMEVAGQKNILEEQTLLMHLNDSCKTSWRHHSCNYLDHYQTFKISRSLASPFMLCCVWYRNLKGIRPVM